MGKYRIQQRIKTVTSNWITDYLTFSRFEINAILIEQEFTLKDGPTGDYWVATSEVDSFAWTDAYQRFYENLDKIISRISLIGQGYINFYGESYLITRSDIPNAGLLRYIKELNHVGLSFTEESKQALEKLINNPTISDEFFWYWTDATNTIGYSAKLLLMFAAIESLNRNRDEKLFPKKKDLSERILGSELHQIIFENRNGLRNRLSHGEYLSPKDTGRDFITEIHQRVVNFFNSEILKQNLINLNVVNPQRHFHDNKEGWGPAYIVRVNRNKEIPLSLNEVMSDFEPYKKEDIYTQAKMLDYQRLKSTF